MNVDIDGNGTADYRARLSPKPTCYRVKTIKVSELDPAIAQDRQCLGSGTAQNTGLDVAGAGVTTGDSLCANSEWNVRAEVSDTRSGTKVAVNQGVAIRVLSTDAANSCL